MRVDGEAKSVGVIVQRRILMIAEPEKDDMRRVGFLHRARYLEKK